MTATTVGAAITAAWQTTTLSPAAVALLAATGVPVDDLHGRTALRAVQVLTVAATRLRGAPQYWMRESRTPMTRVELGEALGEIDAAVSMLRQRLAARIGVQS